MSTSGSRTRSEGQYCRRTSRAIIESGNHKNTSKNLGGQIEAKHCSVPTWEKRFCFQVGGVPWKKVMEAKRYNHIYKNVMEWNDSATKKAFDNAKARFWEEMNGIRSKTRLPDPNKYIDEDIDWEPKIDPEILSGMEAVIDDTDAKAKTEMKNVNELRLEDIVATGWDMEQCLDYRCLTGMVVGD